MSDRTTALSKPASSRSAINSSRVTETTVGCSMSAYSVIEMWQW